MIACFGKTAAFQKPGKIIPGRMLHNAKGTKRNFFCVILDCNFLMTEVDINRCAKLIAVKKTHPRFDIGIRAETVGTGDLIVYRLPADLKGARDLGNTFSLLLHGSHLNDLWQRKSRFSSSCMAQCFFFR